MGYAVTVLDGSAPAGDNRAGSRAVARVWTALAALVLAASSLCGTAPALAQAAVNYLYEFPGGGSIAISIGSNPQVPLVLGPGNTFYGSGRYNGTGEEGTIFSITTGGVVAPVAPLESSSGIALQGLILGTDGNLYAPALQGGTSCVNTSAGAGGCGAVIEVTPQGTLTPLFIFTAAVQGYEPTSLVQGADGNFYGTTAGGGTGSCNTGDQSEVPGCGTVFQLTPGGVLTTLYSFTGNADGAGPTNLILGADGNFYGTTLGSEAYPGSSSSPGLPSAAASSGTVFKITPAGQITTLYTFPATYVPPAGQTPYGGIVQAPDGNFYGTTLTGGANNVGAVYQMTPAGAVTILYSFQGNTTDPGSPAGALIVGSDGNLYGTESGTQLQNTNPDEGGSVFRITPSGTFTVVASFSTSGPFEPLAAVTEGPDHNLYGTLSMGGPYADGAGGAVFQLTGALAAAAAPTVTLAASPGSVTLGQSTTLTWSSTNATACTASGAWTGNEATSGTSQITPAATGTSTYTLTCTGAGGTSPAASVSLKVQSAPATVTDLAGRAGGGGLDGLSLAGLLLLLVLRARRVLKPFLMSMLAMLGLAGVASAQNAPSWDQAYVGIRVGATDYLDTSSRLYDDVSAAGFPDTNFSLSQHRAGGAAFAGIPVLGPLAVELSYVDLGRYPVAVSTTSSSIPALSQTIASKLWPAGQGGTVGLAAPLDLTPWIAIEPRLALLVYGSRQEVFTPLGTFADDRTGTGLDGGLSLLFHLTPRVYIGAGADCYDIGGRCTVLLYSAEVRYRFRGAR
jgi:uncharacterized repeat protein (TIGR03803 family)